jgi:hypothetical protein
VIGVAQCEVCVNEYVKTFEVVMPGEIRTPLTASSAPRTPLLPSATTAGSGSAVMAWRRARSTAARIAPAKPDMAS